MRLYGTAGSKEPKYGLCCASTLEWHGGGDHWNPMGLMPSALLDTYESAKRQLDGLKDSPPDVCIVLVQAVFLPVRIANGDEESDGFIRQTIIDGQSVRIE